MEKRFELIARQATPSIVAISSVSASSDTGSALLIRDIDAPRLAATLDRVSRTVGTGFVIDAEGYILTAEHVVSDATQIWVTTDNQKVYPAMVVGSDPRSDLAVLKVPVKGLKPLTFATPESIHRGQWAVTLGNPYGLATAGDLAMSVGVVSATGRSLPRLSAQENRLYTNLIQTTAEINPGNSGGPLFDLQGQVIGVNAAVVLPQKNTNGIGFAFAATSELLSKVQKLKQGEQIIHAHLGVTVSSALLDNYGGARIDSISADGPSAGSALKVGDVVTRVDQTAIPDSDMFARVVSALPTVRSTTLHIIRGSKALTVEITPRVRPNSPHTICASNQKLYWRGMLLSSQPDGRGFAVQSIDTGSPFTRQGIQQGAVITGVSGKLAGSLLELLSMLSQNDPVTCKLDLAKAANPQITASATMK